MRFAFHQRVAIVSSRGDHIRYVHRAMASALVVGGSAQAESNGGRIKAITLSRTAESYAHRIGEPTPSGFGGVKFTRWTRLDESAVRVIEHHPRCLY